MSCGNAFCTCCREAYLDGVKDGYVLGFGRGIRRGYINGYCDASLGIPPPALCRPAILKELSSRSTTLALCPAIYPCGCIGVCTCD